MKLGEYGDFDLRWDMALIYDCQKPGDLYLRYCSPFFLLVSENVSLVSTLCSQKLSLATYWQCIFGQ